MGWAPRRCQTIIGAEELICILFVSLAFDLLIELYPENVFVSHIIALDLAGVDYLNSFNALDFLLFWRLLDILKY